MRWKSARGNEAKGWLTFAPGARVLGSATLIAEFGDNTYQPIGAIATINEARELVEDDMRVRIDKFGNRSHSRVP